MKTIQEIKEFCQKHKVQAFEYSVNSCDNSNRSRMVVLIGGFGQSNPKSFMDRIVLECVSDGEPYNEYIESTLDNPWIRILFSNINNLIND